MSMRNGLRALGRDPELPNLLEAYQSLDGSYTKRIR